MTNPTKELAKAFLKAHKALQCYYVSSVVPGIDGQHLREDFVDEAYNELIHHIFTAERIVRDEESED